MNSQPTLASHESVRTPTHGPVPHCAGTDDDLAARNTPCARIVVNWEDPGQITTQPPHGTLHAAESSWFDYASLMMPIRLPSGSLNMAMVTTPGISVGNITVVPPAASAWSSVAWRSGTAA